MGRKKIESLDIYDPYSNNDTYEIFDDTVSILSIILFKMKEDYKKGLIVTNGDFEKSFLKYYKVLQKGTDSDYIHLPHDWLMGRGNNCTGKEDVGPLVGASSIEERQEKHFCELMTVLNTEDRLKRFLALAKNSKKINPIAQRVLTKFNSEHKYVTADEYKEPVRNMENISEDTKNFFNDLENTFGKFQCCATKSTLTLGNSSETTIKRKNNGQNKVAFLGGNVGISVVGYESNKRGNFVDFITTLSNPMLLGKFESNIPALISYFEGDEYIGLLSSNYEALQNLTSSNYIKLFDLLKPIADYYGYSLNKDVYKKSGEELRDIFLNDMWNLYSIAIGKTSLFKKEPEFMVTMSGVSPYNASDATLAKSYYNLCKVFRDETIERIEYYDGVSVG